MASNNAPTVRLNGNIRTPTVRCVSNGPDGQPIGVIETGKALKMAIALDVDLIEISRGDPPICKLQAYGKYLYDLKKNKNDSGSKKPKEVQFSPNIDAGDMTRKVAQVRGFLADGHPVSIMLRFSGREQAHKEIGFAVIRNLQEQVKDVSSINKPAALNGNTINLYLSPKKVAQAAVEAVKENVVLTNKEQI